MPHHILLILASAVFLLGCLRWPCLLGMLRWVLILAVICLPVVAICVLGAAADLLGWHWLGDKCAAWIGQEPDPEA